MAVPREETAQRHGRGFGQFQGRRWRIHHRGLQPLFGFDISQLGFIRPPINETGVGAYP